MAITREDLHGLVLVRDCLKADGAFMLVHMLKLALGLEGQHSVLLVASRHTAVHYAHVLRKSGMAMASLVEQGRLAVVDALHLPGPAAAAAQLTSLQALHRRMSRAASALHSEDQRPLLLALDDLTVNFTAGPGPQPYAHRLVLTLSPAMCSLCTAPRRVETIGRPSCTHALRFPCRGSASPAPLLWPTAMWVTTAGGCPAWSTPPQWWWMWRRWRRGTRQT